MCADVQGVFKELKKGLSFFNGVSHAIMHNLPHTLGPDMSMLTGAHPLAGCPEVYTLWGEYYTVATLGAVTRPHVTV